MCAFSYNFDCDDQVRVEGTTAAGHCPSGYSCGGGVMAHLYQVTLNSGDAVFCSV